MEGNEFDNMIHIVPSGRLITLCGLSEYRIQSSSLGFGCNCQKCLVKARDIVSQYIEQEKLKK